MKRLHSAQISAPIVWFADATFSQSARRIADRNVTCIKIPKHAIFPYTSAAMVKRCTVHCRLTLKVDFAATNQ